MGAAASVDSGKPINLDYATLKSSGIDFTAAYSALQSKLKKGKSEVIKGDVSINFLAMRQLSQNLRNQDSLERTRKKILKSRSLPDNLKYKRKSQDPDSIDDYEQQPYSQDEELDHADLDLINDHEYGVHHQEAAASAAGAKETEAEPAKKAQKKKPNLFLHVNSAKGELSEPLEEANSHRQKEKPPSPSANARVSPRGTLYMGKWKVMETGIFPDDSSPANYENVKRNYIQDHGYVSQKTSSGTYLWQVTRNDSGMIVSTSADEDFSSPLLPALGGKKDFVEIATLGSGASGVVSEALHVPSLTLVALKILPIYNQEKRQHVSRELAVLFRNLTEMRLVDDRLDPSPPSPSSCSCSQAPSSSKRCPNVLSLFNAFIDPRSGMINLVVEYMDGGSLEDLVKQGGCRDEAVLADIAYQTLNGLSFLHRNKSVHRDIKPANILCSSQGAIKIADFGISKALDKSTGFANSFVGTVCYMSPERITGEVYSFPCDLWSLGLTLLAVARGRFPISLRDRPGEDGAAGQLQAADPEDFLSDGSSPGVIGGPGGYWAMIKAICDCEPPSAGRSFSSAFNTFIDHCLRKDPAERLTAKQLLASPFVLHAISPGKYDWSPEDFEDGPVAAPEPSPSQRSSLSGIQSPLTARLTSVAVARTVSKDSPAAFPSLAVGQEGGSLKDRDHRRSLEAALALAEDEGMAVVYAIRLEHLERVLDKLACKLRAFQQGDEQEGGKEEEEEARRRTPKGGGLDSKDPDPFSTGSSTGSLDNLLVLPSAADWRARPKQISFQGQTAGSDDDKIVPISKTHSRTATGLASSTRSVHFQEEPAKSTGNARGNFRSRANLKALELDVIDDEDEDPHSTRSHGQAQGLSLPKTSSYFIASQSKDDQEEQQTSGKSSNSSGSGKREDYSKIIPRFDSKGLAKWRNLAQQLHLPLSLVMLAIRSTLGSLIDLDENDSDEEDAGS